MKLLLILLGLAIITSTNASAQVLGLDGEWRFQLDPENVGVDAGWWKSSFDDSEWGHITVPGTVPDDFDGVAWYRRSIDLPDELREIEDLAVVFGAVDDHAKVWLNGTLSANSTRWNRTFHARVPKTPAVPPRLTIAVRVEDQGGPGGIWKTVRVQALSDNIEDLYKNEFSDLDAMTSLEDIGAHVMYSVFVRNFSPEGTFDGLRERLPELKSLGVDILWLLPIHEIGLAERKGTVGSPYAIRDYYSVNSDLGTEDDLRELVEAAHDLEMKIIIDLVLNHTSPDSVLVEEHLDWFIKDPDTGKPVADNPDWWDIVDLDWENPEVWTYCENMMAYWVEEFGIDGYRADVASLMPTEFWDGARRRLETINPDVIMLAESDAADLHLKSFDLSYNWALYDTLVGIIAGEMPAGEMRQLLTELKWSHPRGAARVNFVENHDKERAINVFGGAPQAKLAAALTVTLPGVPLLYTGTETGASETRDIFEKIPTTFNSDEFGMRAFWSSLLALRAENPAFQTGDLTVIQVGPSDQFFAFERTAGENRVLVIANMRGTGAEAKISHDLVPTDTLYLGPWGWSVWGE